MQREAAVARRYAKALGTLAAAAGRLEPVAEELTAFERLLAGETGLRQVLERPWVRAGAKRQLMRAVAAELGLSLLTQNFLALLAQRRRIPLLAEVLAAYRVLADEAAGRVRARVTSAVPLGEPEQAAIVRGLARRLGRTVVLGTEVDPPLLGGFVAEVGSRVWDASLTGQLRALREQIIQRSRGSA